MSVSSVDYNALFRLSDPFATRPFRLSSPDELSFEQACTFSRGGAKPDLPVELRAYMGGQAMDVLWGGLIGIIAISDRLRDSLQSHQITGWSTYPVTVFGRKGEFLPGYHGLAITGRGIDEDRTRGEIIVKPPIVPGGRPPRVRKGLFFEESKWDGSDMFRVGGHIVVTIKVKRLFRRERVRNVKFTPLPDFEKDLIIEEVIQRHNPQAPPKLLMSGDHER